MVENVPALASILAFYFIILSVAIGAAWWKRNNSGDRQSETFVVARRDMGLFVGCFTMTATWIGGGYINYTSETVYTAGYGLVWTQAPFGLAISLILGGIFFAKTMREQEYVTMLDPLQRKLGRRMGCLLFLPALMGELLWSAAILTTLGNTIEIILGFNAKWSVIVSAIITLLYTLIGGIYSVAYTDVFQFFCMFFGLWISIPFALTNDAVGSVVETATGSDGWLGTWDLATTGQWIDSIMVLMFGRIPWQVYFQRILSSDSSKTAQLLSFAAAVGCIVMAIPSIFIGAIGVSTNWTETDYKDGLGTSPEENGEQRMILPIVMQYLTPPAVSLVGVLAILGAVMSSVDSSILSASSLFTRNIYKHLVREKASEMELLWILRLFIIAMTALATYLALSTESAFELWCVCGDFVYVILFPQLFCVIYFDPNTYGSLLAFVVGLTLRLGGGEPAFGLKSFIPYPCGANFPFKTFSMVCSMVILISVSYLFKYLFKKRILDQKYDIFDCNLAYYGRNIDPYLDHIVAKVEKRKKPEKTPSTREELKDWYDSIQIDVGKMTETSFYGDSTKKGKEGVENLAFEVQERSGIAKQSRL